MTRRERMGTAGKRLAILVILCALPRVGLWLVYEPIRFNDTAGYESVAQRMRSALVCTAYAAVYGRAEVHRCPYRYAGYSGARTPGYPLLLLLGGMNSYVVWLLQSILGVGAAVLLYRMVLLDGGNASLAMAVALLVGWSLNLMFLEAAMLTESLATLLVILALYLFTAVRRLRSHELLYCTAFGLVCTAAGLTRPLLLCLIPLGALFLLLPLGTRAGARVSLLSPKKPPPDPLLGKEREPMRSVHWRPPLRRGDYRGVGLFLLAALLPVLAWSAVNKVAVDYFGPTTLLGYNLTQHSGGFIELAPAEYAAIRDVYLEFRERQRAQRQSHSMTIWQANGKMRQVTGLSFGELSRQLTRMSVLLFVEHPDLYLRSVALSWWKFWQTRDTSKLESIRWQRLSGWLRTALEWEGWLLLAMKLTFALAVVSSLYAAATGSFTESETFSLSMSVVIVASIVQALIELGENARYALPFQPLVIYVSCSWLWRRLRLNSVAAA